MRNASCTFAAGWTVGGSGWDEYIDRGALSAEWWFGVRRGWCRWKSGGRSVACSQMGGPMFAAAGDGVADGLLVVSVLGQVGRRK